MKKDILVELRRKLNEVARLGGVAGELGNSDGNVLAIQALSIFDGFIEPTTKEKTVNIYDKRKAIFKPRDNQNLKIIPAILKHAGELITVKFAFDLNKGNTNIYIGEKAYYVEDEWWNGGWIAEGDLDFIENYKFDTSEYTVTKTSKEHEEELNSATCKECRDTGLTSPSEPDGHYGYCKCDIGEKKKKNDLIVEYFNNTECKIIQIRELFCELEDNQKKLLKVLI